MKPTVAVLGASRDRSKYGNKSVRAHAAQGYQVYPVNPNEQEVEGLACYATLADVPVEGLDRITIYLPPVVGIELLEQIRDKGAREIYFNPGSDSPELIDRAEQLGLEVIRACSMVDIGEPPANYPDE